jgi:hypothetical protein
VDDAGRKFADSLSALGQYCEEIDSLQTSLKDLVTRAFDVPGTREELPCRVFGSWTSTVERAGSGGWLVSDRAWSLPLKGKTLRGRARPEKHLSYQISLVGDGIHAPGNFEPLLHVCLWDDPISFRDGYYAGFPLDHDDAAALRGCGLLAWPDPENPKWAPEEWTYSLRLFALESSEMLERCAIVPAIRLLCGVPATEALTDDLPGLVTYTSIDGLMNKVPA